VVADSRAAAPVIAAAWESSGASGIAAATSSFAAVIVAPDRVVAIRDAFGSRPLFWWASPEGVVLASEVGALLAAGAPRDLDPIAVLAGLRQDWHTEPETTYFRAIRRVPPGAAVEITASGSSWSRWWRPPASDPALADPREAARAFGDVLRDVIVEQLGAEKCALVQLSGGLDSAGVATVADALRKEGRIGAELIAASAVFPGFPADESRWIDPICRAASLRCERYSGLSGPRDALPFEASHPWREIGWAIPEGWKAAARRHGATMTTGGHGGDELLFENGVLLDLAANGRLRELWREAGLATRYSSVSRWHHLDVPLRHLLPAPVRRAFRALRPREEAPPPPWAGPLLRDVAVPDVAADGPELPHVARVTWAGLVSPGRAWIADILELDAARAGLGFASPYQDRRVADLVLSVPWEARVPHGRMKALLRDGLAGVLPPEIRERQGVTGFDEVFVAAGRAQLPLIRSAVVEGPWASEGWVDRPAARRLLDEAQRAGVLEPWLSLWAITTLELWLRSGERPAR
jgi:asparagine synthase (glutamine-hydrolysing)